MRFILTEKTIDSKKNWLNECGQMEWQHKIIKNTFAHRYYYWVNRVSFTIEENESRIYSGSVSIEQFFEKLYLWKLIKPNK